jgi:phage shock protein A
MAVNVRIGEMNPEQKRLQEEKAAAIAREKLLAKKLKNDQTREAPRPKRSDEVRL